ncbi:MAG: DNA double-strand break repair nuclease NurA [Promethearchaeota archaeon]
MTLDSKKIEAIENLETEQIPFGLTKEQIFSNNLKLIANKLINLEHHKIQFSELLLKNLDKLDFSDFVDDPYFLIKEKRIKTRVEASNIYGLNYACVDGSSVLKNFMNIDFSFLKAIVVKYYFKDNFNADISYFPDLNGFNNYAIEGNYLNTEEQVMDAKVSLDLRFMELNLLNELLTRESDIDLIIIDGSILITPINLIFSKNYEISQTYDKLLQEYQKLYYNCKENRVLLVGVIKDTKTSALTNELREAINLLKPNTINLQHFLTSNYRILMDYFTDLDLFNRVLEKGERSCVFKIKREIDKIRDDGIKKEIPYYFPLDFHAFYLKSVRHDFPIRIEFFLEKGSSRNDVISKANLIASLLLPISSCNENYALPIPQIEAHKRATFKPSEIDFLFNNLVRSLHKHGLQLVEKRRNRRPF